MRRKKTCKINWEALHFRRKQNINLLLNKFYFFERKTNTYRSCNPTFVLKLRCLSVLDESTNDRVKALEETELLSASKGKRKSSYHCCVPRCNGDSRYHKELVFHRMPSGKENEEIRKRWVIKIRRDEGPDFKVKL